MPTVAETIVTALAELGVKQIWGVVGDALNPVTDAIRREDRLEWIGVRHEEAGAFAASAQDAIFTTDTGMSSVWLSRFVTLSGTRRLIGSYNLGSMANAMPMALGAQALDRNREVVAFCGDGGLTMLLGDIITAVQHRLPVRLVVFNNGRLGIVKLEQEQGGLPEFGTKLHDVDLAAIASAAGLQAIRVTDPDALSEALRSTFAHPGPALIDVVTNPDESRSH